MNRRNKLNAGVGYAHYDGIDGSSITVLDKRTPSTHPFKVIPIELESDKLKFIILEGWIFGLEAWGVSSHNTPEEGDLKFTYDPGFEPLVEVPPKRLKDSKIGTFSINLKSDSVIYIELEAKYVEETEKTETTAKLKYKSKTEAMQDYAKNPLKSTNPFDPVVVGSRFPNSNSIGGFPSQMTIAFGDPPTWITIEQSMRYVQNTTVWQGIAQYPIALTNKDAKGNWVITQILKSDIDWPFAIGITTKSHDVAVQRFFASDEPPPPPDGCDPCNECGNCCCEGGCCGECGGGGTCCDPHGAGCDCGGGGGGGGGSC